MPKLNLCRIWIMWIAALGVIAWYWVTDPNGGAETIARLQWLAWLVVVTGPVYLVRRALAGASRGRDAYTEAMRGNVAAGLVYAGLCILTGLLFLAFAGQARAAELPAGAVKHLPALDEEISAHWPSTPLRSALAAQIEQETCASLRSPKCWSPRAELKTAREYGFGLGQVTVTSRFDNFAEARKLDVTLRDWRWEDRYDARRQLRTLVLMDRGGFERLRFVADERERLAMTFAAYNGGLGGVLQDRRVCAQAVGCDPNRWFGHVERHSTKSRVKWQGYGASAYDINRGYVRAVLIDRRPRYVGYFGEV